MSETKVISAMEARKRFGEIMNRVALRGDRYIIERAGKPLVSVEPIAAKTASKRSKDQKINLNDPFENPFATFTEWNDPSNDIYDNL
ncbi:MAG TPA: type II toxin-antitoxin system prevent-host-death family antitoxin [Candidatus Paceibacterota bacterium]